MSNKSKNKKPGIKFNSVKRKSANQADDKKKNRLLFFLGNSVDVQDLKDKAILSGWITGLILIISMLWIFTNGLQANYLLRSVNSVFANNYDSRRLSAFINVKSHKADILGYWYSMNNTTDRMFVFTVFKDGIMIPLGAVVKADGKVDELMPLSAHAVQVFDDLPDSILQMYITRIEDSAAESFAN